MRSFGGEGKDPLSWNGGTKGKADWLCYGEQSLEVGGELLKLMSDLLPLR